MELLVFLAILAPVLSVVGTFVPFGIQCWNRHEGLIEAQQHARIALDELQNELVFACWVEVDSANQRVTYEKRVGNGWKRYVIYLLEGQLLHRLPEGTAVPLASNINALLLSPNGAIGQAVFVTVVATSDGSDVVLRTAIVPRNLQWLKP